MAEKNVQSRVLQYMEGNPGKRLHLESMADALGIDKFRVQGGVYQLTRRHGVREHIEVVLKGRCWIWHPAIMVDKEPDKHEAMVRQAREELDEPVGNPGFQADIHLHRIGLGQQGIVAQDEDGALWLLHKL